MAYSRNIDSYPIACFRAIEDVLVNGTRLVIPCGSAKEAAALRFRFYGLRYAMMQSKNPRHPLADQVAKVQFVAESAPDSHSLIVEFIEDSPLAQDLDIRVINAMEAARRKT